jgi:hypothetical protein
MKHWMLGGILKQNYRPCHPDTLYVSPVHFNVGVASSAQYLIIYQYSY